MDPDPARGGSSSSGTRSHVYPHLQPSVGWNLLSFQWWPVSYSSASYTTAPLKISQRPMAELVVLSSGRSTPLDHLQSSRRSSRRRPRRVSEASIGKQGPADGPWRPFGGRGNLALSPPSRSTRQAQHPGMDGNPARSGKQVAEESRVGSVNTSGSSASNFLSLLCPLLKFFGVRINMRFNYHC